MAGLFRHYRKFSTIVNKEITKNLGKSLRAEKDGEVILSQTGKVAFAVLNRPKQLNALSLIMGQTLASSHEKFIRDKASLILVKAPGDTVFSAGGDLAAFVDPARVQTVYRRVIFHTAYRYYYAISILPIPHCTYMNGLTMGGGAAIAAFGRYRIGTEKSVFAMPEVQVGYFPNAGGTYFLTRLEGKLGHYLGLTGNPLKGADVYHAGIATHAVDSANYPQLETELLSLPLDDPFNEVDKCLQKFTKEANFLQDRPFSLVPHMDLINECFSAPTVEGIFDNLLKANDPFAKATLKKLSSLSPLALKVTKKALDEATFNSMEDCFQMEYRLSTRMCESHDFHEGVRARIIDKDLNPVWKIKRLEDCSEEYVNSFFAPLPNDALNLHEVQQKFTK